LQYAVGARIFLQKKTWKEFFDFVRVVRKEKYDLIIDAQGLIKSALITRMAKGTRVGLDSSSAREKLAALFYQKKFSVKREQHAIHRTRELFSRVLNYPTPNTIPDYGIDRTKLFNSSQEKYLVFLHGTTWVTKHWPEDQWIALAEKAKTAGINVKLLWGNAEEKTRAEKIVSCAEHGDVMPRLDLISIAKLLAGAAAFVGVDTGLGHLAAALNVPGVSLYGPTNPELTGALGASQIHLTASIPCAPCLNRECKNPAYLPEKKLPCFAVIDAERVWNVLHKNF